MLNTFVLYPKTRWNFFIFKSTITDVGIEVWHCLRFFSWQPNSWYLTLISENGSKKKWGGNAFSTFVQTRVQFILGFFFGYGVSVQMFNLNSLTCVSGFFLKRNYFKKQSSSSSFLLTWGNNTGPNWPGVLSRLVPCI